MQFNRMTLGKQAREMGYVRDTFEKVCRLSDVLETIWNDPFLSDKLVLKGGTAINLTIFNLPRLSVDIDMDFAENMSRERMLTVREQVSGRIGKYMSSGDYRLSLRSKSYHALDSFVYEYQNAGGIKDNIKIEINYMNRCHVLSPINSNVNLPWLDRKIVVHSVDPLEIFGSKIVALLNRSAPRDLYDVNSMFQYGLFDETQYPMLKKCAMFYNAIGSETTPEQFCFDNLSSISQQRIKTDLIPVLRKGAWFDAKQAQEKVSTELKQLLNPTEEELSFWTAFRNKEYRPEYLFNDSATVERVKEHPMALWKCSER